VAFSFLHNAKKGSMMLLQNQRFCLGRYVCRVTGIRRVTWQFHSWEISRHAETGVSNDVFRFFFQQDMHQSRCFSVLT
jgi:hypothetical protein